jgi:hypothetical protein
MALYKGEDKIKDIYLGDVPIFKVYAGEEFCGFFTFSHENLMINGNFSNGTTGWQATTGSWLVDSFTVSNGQAIIVTSVSNAGINQGSPVISGHTYYYSMKLTNTERCYFETSSPFSHTYIVPGTNQVFSKILTHTDTLSALIYIRNHYNLTNTITVDYVIKYDITDLVSRGILPSGLTDAQYKDILDNYFNS